MASLLCSRAAAAFAAAPLRARAPRASSSASAQPLRASRRGAVGVTAAAAVPLHVEYCQA
jgi:hypothetical protein